MNRKISYILLFLTLLSNFAFSGNQQSAPQKRILALYSYDATFITYKNSIQAFHDVFTSDKFIIDVEFLDSKRYVQGELNQTVFDRIKIKQQIAPYDIVITGHDNALNYCITYQETLFKNTPIIFWGINDIENAYSMDKNPWITGITDNIDPHNTFNIIKQLHHEIKNIHIIHDITTTGKADYKTYIKAIEAFDLNYNSISIGDYTLDEFEEKLSSIDPEELILVLSALRSKERYISLNEINTILKKHSDKIIYNNYFYQSGYNFAAGRNKDFYNQAFPACLIAKQVINGTPIQNIHVEEGINPKELELDFQEMKRFGIDVSDFTGNAKIINTPKNEYTISKKALYAISSLVIAFVAFLFFSILFLRAKNKIEKSLRLTAENYSSIFKENHSIMLIVDPKTGRIYDANKSACNFYGYSISEFRQLKIKDINTLAEFDLKRVLQLIDTGNIQIQVKHKIKNGSIKDVEVHAGKIEMGSKIYFYAIVLDISDRMQQQQQLIEARKKAEESDQLKSAFLANMSHEIRTPMNSILGFSSLLAEDELGALIKAQYLNYIQSNGEHLLQLINDIIDISKIEANQLSIRTSDCRINSLLDEIFEIFNNQIKDTTRKKIRLVLGKDIKDDKFSINTDEIRLKQIIMNLLGNALKFTDSGKIEFGYKFREDSMLQFYVKDTGIGIPSDKQNTIFSVFKQIEDSKTRSYGGTGLGLSISKSIVEKLGGSIWVVSELGEGSRFYFTISATTNLLNLT